jgi:hypothetical protein
VTDRKCSEGGNYRKLSRGKLSNGECRMHLFACIYS